MEGKSTSYFKGISSAREKLEKGKAGMQCGEDRRRSGGNNKEQRIAFRQFAPAPL